MLSHAFPLRRLALFLLSGGEGVRDKAYAMEIQGIVKMHAAQLRPLKKAVGPLAPVPGPCLEPEVRASSCVTWVWAFSRFTRHLANPQPRHMPVVNSYVARCVKVSSIIPT